MPYHAAVFHDECLGRLVPNAKTLRDRVRQFAIFDDENNATRSFGVRIGELRELFVDLSADRALRAMLENKNGIGFRCL